MEKKTDLSQEFGLLSDHSDREFHASRAEDATDRNAEFNRAPSAADREFGGAYQDKEFFGKSQGSGGAQRKNRRERHRRTLLLQMAAAALSVVVVTSSFGLDILGENTEPELSPGGPENFVFMAQYDDVRDAFTEPVTFSREDAASEMEFYDGTVRYEPTENTLVLDGCELHYLELHQMGDDFTIHVERDSSVGKISSVGPADCSVHISGEPGQTLAVNQRSDVVWDYGITLEAGDRSVLSVGESIVLQIYGDRGAAAISSAAQQAIVYDESRTVLSGVAETGDFNFTGAFAENPAYPVWTVTDGAGTVLNDVSFRPAGGGSAPPAEIPQERYLSVLLENQTSVVLCQNGEIPADSLRYPDAFRYDPDTNTLTIYSEPLDTIFARNMGHDFTVHAAENAVVCGIHVEAGASEGSLTLTGDNTTLRVNPDSARSDGISLDAAGGHSYLTIEPSVSMEAFGRQAAISVSNSTAMPAIVYDPIQSYLSGNIAVGDFGLLSLGADSEAAVDTIVADDFGAPAKAVYMAGGWEEITGLSGYSELYVTDSGNGRPVYLVQGGEITVASWNRADLRYDPDTNTLTLDDFTGGIVSARMMGEDFIIQYDGENKLDAILCRGHRSVVSGSLSIDGSYGASLVVNEDRQWPAGIHLSADRSSSALSVLWGTELEVYGSEAAVLVENSSAEQGIVTEPVTGVSGSVFSRDSAADPVFADWYISQSVSDGDTPGTYVGFRRLISVEHDSITRSVTVTEPLRRKAPYDNPYVDEIHIDGYSMIDSGTTHTITNEGTLPVYIYLYQYTYCAESTPVEVAKGNDWEVLETVDMQGQYYCPGGVRYLTADGNWEYDFTVSGSMLQEDAARINSGESLAVSLPEDGTDSIYMLYAETYDPERDYSWWIYSSLKFNGT